MKKNLVTFLFFTYAALGFSQFSDNFSDGEFLDNPSWEGSVDNFEVDSSLKLHLNDSIANTSYLSTPSHAIINGSWEFEVKLDFDPSTSNYAKAYLTSSSQSLNGPLNGYFIKIGGESGFVDDVSLYVQNGLSTTKIIDGTNGLASSQPDLKIKVLRDGVGNWELFIDTAGTYFLDGATFNNTTTSSGYFGVYCKYTSTRSDKFWFDNFIITGAEDTSTTINAKQNDVIINEIFADPTPSVGLPEYEYLELYNTTSSAIDLSGWTITLGTSKKIFPPATIEPDSFVLLIKEDVVDSFPNNISKIGLPSVSLTNEGGNIILKDNAGRVINSISYTNHWYGDNNKSAGGWSIERIRPALFCEAQNNWKASKSNVGGTPGIQNSVFEEDVIIEGFRITKALIVDSNKVEIHFNKSLDSLSFQNDESLFTINGNEPILSSIIAPFFKSIYLTFGFNFFENTTYTISAGDLSDCSGNLISNSFHFGIPDSVLENQIVINEILFNPKEDGVDYVELFNNSNSYFDLSKLRLANFFELGFQNYPDNPKTITEEPSLFSPKSYLVLTSDSAKVQKQYYCKNPLAFIQVSSMPSLSNDSGSICVVHQSLNQIIDAFAYNESMHFSLLETPEGVSLERIDVGAPTQVSGSWHSAASTAGFGTPTYKNSQELITQSAGKISINPKSFTPNNDGNKDICSINWNFNQPNLMATIKIFDAKGRFVKTLLNNEMIGNSGGIIWGGGSEAGDRLNTGIYIVWMEVFSQNGWTERFKEVVVLSR